MAKVHKKTVNSCGGLVEFLEQTQSSRLVALHKNHTCFQAYEEVKCQLRDIQETVVLGAMKESVASIIDSYREKLAMATENHEETQHIGKMMSDDAVVFLNDHGPKHVENVIRFVNKLISCSTESANINELEAFILLCAIQIHDIGNVFGRAGHEKKLVNIFKDSCSGVVCDNCEARYITDIAKAHGGKTPNNDKNTIIYLQEEAWIDEYPIRPRLLAALLRFGDELADDFARDNQVATDLKIINTDSRIFHAYSDSLKSVAIKEKEPNGKNVYSVFLHYFIGTNEMETPFDFCGDKKFLLDEIYDRTLKMERERRYFSKFLKNYISIDCIVVRIERYDEELENTGKGLSDIKYTLEDNLFPNEPDSVSCISGEYIPSGQKQFESLKEMKEGNVHDN